MMSASLAVGENWQRNEKTGKTIETLRKRHNWQDDLKRPSEDQPVTSHHAPERRIVQFNLGGAARTAFGCVLNNKERGLRRRFRRSHILGGQVVV
jgi:hypothetical protein